MEWMEKQGPLCPSLIQYLAEHQNEYKSVIFFTYLYYTSAIGIKSVTNKIIMIPTAHDEPFLQMRIFDDVFLKPNAFFFNTDEERKLIQGKYHNEHIPYALGGTGVDLPASVDGGRFKEKYGLENYIVYVGRIDEGKNCGEMFRFWADYKKRNQNDLKLVLIGKSVMEILDYTSEQGGGDKPGLRERRGQIRRNRRGEVPFPAVKIRVAFDCRAGGDGGKNERHRERGVRGAESALPKEQRRVLLHGFLRVRGRAELALEGRKRGNRRADESERKAVCG